MSLLINASRRTFLQTGAAGLAAAAAPGTVRSANDRINIGVIGMGNRGTGLLRELVRMKDGGYALDVVAVCDVYRRRVNQAQDLSGAAKAVLDYREVIADPSIDVVVIATPDHWHAQMAIAACNAGKDVYLEKPMTHTLEEAKQVWQTVEKTKRVMQVGSQHASEDSYWKARQAVQAGVIGTLLMAQGSAHRNYLDGNWGYPIEAGAGPDKEGDDYVDWKMWLGNMPQRPYDPEVFFVYRKKLEFSGGICTDLFFHRLTVLTTTWGGGKFPWRATGTGDTFVYDDWTIPDTYTMTADYPNGPHLVLTSSMANDEGTPITLRGHEGTIAGRTVTPQLLFADGFRAKCEAAGLKGEWEPIPVRGGRNRQIIEELRLTTEPRATHMENFLECVRTRQKPVLDALTGFQIQAAISLSVEAFKRGMTMYFDEKKLEMTDKPIPKPV